MREIIAPRKICLYRDETMLSTLFFLQQIYESTENGTKYVTINFNLTEEITAAASVVLFAHINRIQLISKNPAIFTFRCKNSPLYSTFFKPIYLKVLEAGTEEKLNFLEQSNSYYQSGTLPHLKLPVLDRIFEPIQHFYSTNQSVLSILGELKTAINEALLNVHHHAYLGFDVDVPTRWWQQILFQPKDNSLQFIIYDLGIGIVNSFLEHSTHKPTMIFQNKSDILREIMKTGVSRLPEVERGNGLSEMFKLSNYDNMAVWLSTNQLILKKAKPYNIDECEECLYSIPGTLVEWHFQLEGKM